MEAIKRKLTVLLEELFLSEGFIDCYLVELILSKSGKVQVFVDCDSGVSFTKCGTISRHLEKYLDESLVLGEKYTLEVSSPGIGRPLIKRQYPKNIGRQVKVWTKDGKRIKGTLTAVKEESITLLIQVSAKEQTSLNIAFNDIEQSKIIVSF